jgi:hypothetical protein
VLDTVYSWSQHGLALISYVAIALLVWRGRLPERIAAAAFVGAMFGTPLVDGFQVAGVRYGVAVLAALLALTLFVLSFRADRWWLLAAAGVQLLSLGTWAVAIFGDVQVWAAVTVRMIVWLLLMIIALFGVWEARSAPYAQAHL